MARRLSDAVLARADRDYDIIVNYDDIPFNSDEIIAMNGLGDGMIACHSECFSAAVVGALDSRLRIVAHKFGWHFDYLRFRISVSLLIYAFAKSVARQ